MPILTRSGMERLLKRLLETGGLTPKMEDDIKRLKDDFDEREGILRKYGEVYDGDDREEYEYKSRDNGTVYEAEEKSRDWESMYNDLKERYISRFLGKSEEVLRKAEKEVENPDDEEDLSVEDLFEEVK